MSQPPPDLIAELTSVLDAPQATTSFAARAARIEALEAHVLERLALLGSARQQLHALAARAETERARLATRNSRLVQRLAGRIASGMYTRRGLRVALARLADPRNETPGYDALDELLAELWDAGELPDEVAALEPEMVAYQPTPGRVILELVERAALSCEDVLCDLGSGLGHVLLGAALLSGARGVGVELEPAYCAYAAACARRLRLPQLTFMACDAREAPLDEANVFYLYTPFRGTLLDQVLERLAREASARPLVVCSYGPCSAELARAAWLSPRDAHDFGPNKLCVFDSV